MFIKIIFSLLVFFTHFLLESYEFDKITILAPDTAGSNRLAGPYQSKLYLIRGLQELGVVFNVNPKLQKDFGDLVLVLYNHLSLKKAIKLKKSGVIKKIISLQMFNRPNRDKKLLSSREIDLFLYRSDWIRKAFEKYVSALRGKTNIWPSGTDPEIWKPKDGSVYNKGKDVVLYVKGKSNIERFSKKISNALVKYNWNPIVIKYGSYTPVQFKEALEKSVFAVFLSRSETQGRALYEAWSMNVPTFAWDPGSFREHKILYKPSSSCPYLTDQTGKRWRTIEEFENLIISVKDEIRYFSPRKWVLENMTYQVSTNMLLDIIAKL